MITRSPNAVRGSFLIAIPHNLSKSVLTKRGLYAILALNVCEGKTIVRKTFHKPWIRKLLLLLGLIAYFSVAITVLKKTGIGCVFLWLFDVPCPGCGMTRAVSCLLRLDPVGAFRHHPLVFAMPYIFGYIFFDFKGRAHKYILLGIGAVAVVNWLLNVCWH